MRDHIRFDGDNWELELLDQRALPLRTETFVCRSANDAVEAIKKMAVRGAPAIGVVAAYACVLAARELNGRKDWEAALEDSLDRIRSARPTAVNLAWAVDRMNAKKRGADPEEIAVNWLAEARAIQEEDIRICKAIGAAGADLIKDGDTVLTHCNAGALATAGYGTALGVIRAAVAKGRKVSVIADETRPLLQGARLTAYELALDGIPVTLACDNACAALMGKGEVQLVIAGADRIAANGDAANKIGTFGVAIMAKYFNIPFYAAAPLSTIDLRTPDGAAISIESRDEKEVLEIAGVRVAPEGVGAYNYAFDVTPAALIAGIITELGVLRAPYQESIKKAFERRGSDFA